MQSGDLRERATPQDFVSRNDLRSWLAIGRDWSLVLALIALSEWVGCWWWTALCLLALGALQFAIGEALLHEASHYNLFRVRVWNDRLDALYALPFLISVKAWRAEHIEHHRRLGKSGDHILQDYAFHGLTSDSSRAAWVWFSKPALGLTAIDHLRGLWEINSVPSWVRIGIFWAPVLGICATWGLWFELLLYWFLPMLTIYATLLHWSEVADHYRARTGARSRTGRIHNWLWHNNGYHAIHHRYPMVPFYHLPRAHRALGGERWDAAAGWWDVWRQISRSPEPIPERWAGFWPRVQTQR